MTTIKMESVDTARLIGALADAAARKDEVQIEIQDGFVYVNGSSAARYEEGM